MGRARGRLLLAVPLRTRVYRAVLNIFMSPMALFFYLAVRNALYHVSSAPWLTFLLIWSAWGIAYYAIVCRLLDRLALFESGIRKPLTHGSGPIFLTWDEISGHSWEGNKLCLTSAGEIASFSIPKRKRAEVQRIVAQFTGSLYRLRSAKPTQV